MAVGQAAPDAKSFTLDAVRGSLINGIVSNPFLEQAFRTDRYTIKVDIHEDGTWSYEAGHAADHSRPVRASSTRTPPITWTASRLRSGSIDYSAQRYGEIVECSSSTAH